MAKAKKEIKIYKTQKRMEFRLKGKCDNCNAVDYLQCEDVYSNWVCDTCHYEMVRDVNDFKNNFKIEIVAIVKNQRKFNKTNNLEILTLTDAIKKLPKGKALKVTALTENNRANRYTILNKIYRAGVLAERKISVKWGKDGIPVITHRK